MSRVRVSVVNCKVSKIRPQRVKVKTLSCQGNGEVQLKVTKVTVLALESKVMVKAII